MNDTPHDGGPAFPHPALADETFRPSYDMGGMSMRDWYAGQALAGLLASDPASNLEVPALYSAIADATFKMADAMIAARAAK